MYYRSCVREPMESVTQRDSYARLRDGGNTVIASIFILSGNDDKFEIQWDSNDGQHSRFFYFAEKVKRKRLVLGNNKH